MLQKFIEPHTTKQKNQNFASQNYYEDGFQLSVFVNPPIVYFYLNLKVFKFQSSVKEWRDVF